jgi:tRNA pseudouridine13 synthase
VREAHPVERTVGIDWYASDADGTGGRLRREPEAFRVRELERVDLAPVDADPGDYRHLVCRVELRGWDTNDFAARLSDALGMSRERVSWAGTKDKHATTTQLVSLDRVAPDDLADVEIRDATIEPVGRQGRPLLFGDLAGNAFEIVVAAPETPENAGAVTADLVAVGGADANEPQTRDDNDDATRDDHRDAGEPSFEGAHEARIGVPNYFGHQRFGSRRPVTHVVGLHVVRGEWREAVLAYVGNPHEREPEETRTARRRVDEAVADGDPDWGALVEEYPGYLRHERGMLHRLAGGADWRGALEAVPSNLQRLFVNAAQSYVFNRILGERLDRGLPFDRPVAGDVVCFADRGNDVPAAVALPDPDRTQRVTDRRVDVIARHCERGRAFVTAPLVGTGTELGDGEPGEIERSVLDDLELSPADFSLPGEFDSTGTRRAVLVRTDVAVTLEPLTFSFSLPSGSYATTVLREYLKVDPREL